MAIDDVFHAATAPSPSLAPAAASLLLFIVFLFFCCVFLTYDSVDNLLLQLRLSRLQDKSACSLALSLSLSPFITFSLPALDASKLH